MHHLTFAVLSWDPGLRGVLTVVAAVVIFCGSAYLLLATNLGTRLGFLLALSALTGWLFLMGVVWSFYGIGKQGVRATWVVKEVNRGDLADVDNPIAKTVPEPDALPSAQDFLKRDPALAKQFPTGNGLKRPNLGDLIGVQPSVEDKLKLKDGWKLLATADPTTGEATATASTFLVDDGIFADPANFVVLEAFAKGGKKPRPDVECTWPWQSGCLERAWFKVKRVATWPLGNPPKWAVVQVRQVVPQETVAGQPPPLPVADDSQPVISVIMERDLGSKRLPSVILTLVSGLTFAICCNTLHRRDKRVAEARSAALAKT
jgi:hypothetical protein